MASEVINLSFANRQSGIVSCKVVNLLFLEGEVRAEYINGSEHKEPCGLWVYTFLIQDTDLDGLEFDDIKSCNLLDPYWECNVPGTPNTCDYDELLCFEGIDQTTDLLEDDMFAFVNSDPDCEWDCLAIAQPEIFFEDEDFLPGETPTPPATPTVTPTPPPTPTPTPTPTPPETPVPTPPVPTPVPTPSPTVPPTPSPTPSFPPTPPPTPPMTGTPSPTPSSPSPSPTVPATPSATPPSTFSLPPITLPPTPSASPTPPPSPSATV